MAAAVDTFEQYEGKLAKEIFHEPFIKSPELADQGILVMADIETRLKVWYTSKLSKITKLKNGCSTPSDDSNGVDITSKNIDVVEMEIYKEQCYDVFKQTIMEAALKKGVDINNLSDTDMDKLIAQLIVEAGAEDYYILLWFGDDSLSGFYAAFDGFFKRIKAAVALNSTPNEPITSMSSAADAYNILKAVFDNQLAVMKSISVKNKVFNVTRNIYDLYVEYLSTLNGSEVAYTNVVNGIATPTFMGIPVKVRDLWDTTFNADFSADFGNGRVVLNVINESLIVGLDVEGEDTLINSRYSPDKRKQIYEGFYKVGTEIKFEQYLSVAGFESASS